MDTDFLEVPGTLSVVGSIDSEPMLTLHTLDGDFTAKEVLEAQRAHAALDAYYLLSAEDKKRVDAWGNEHYGS